MERLSEDQQLILPPPKDPMAVARRFVGERWLEGEHPILRAWRGGWWQWGRNCWREVEHRDIREIAYRFTENAVYEVVTPKGVDQVPWQPNRHKVADLLEALQAVLHTESREMPQWLQEGPVPAVELVACANGLLHVPTRRLLKHTPTYFNQIAVPFHFQAAVEPPTRWLQFLDELWPGDPDSIAALQEFFGYVISGRINLHKILLLIGPTRSGKGTIARVLKALVGEGNHCGPTLASLGTNFGLSPLIGKPLAIISDARLGAGTNAHQVVERLLSISGEDMLTVDRKYREPWTGTLPTRFFVISNELPRFGDVSGAIAGRFIVLVLTESWYGREDPGLTPELYSELPGILSWSLDGLERLRQTNRFTEPQSSVDAIVALQDLVSPVAAFVRQECERSPHEVPIDDLWTAWKVWAEGNGHHHGNKSTFGRDLRAVIPGLRVTQPRDEHGKQSQRFYRGLRFGQTHNGETRVSARVTEPEGNESKPDTPRHAHRPIVGSTKTHDGDGLRPGRKPASPELVAQVRAAYEEAHSYSAAARLLTGRSVPTSQGGSWYPTTVRLVLGLAPGKTGDSQTLELDPANIQPCPGCGKREGYDEEAGRRTCAECGHQWGAP